MELESNVLYYGDNLDVLRKHMPDESIDLIYLDPPFNSNRSYNVLFRESTGAGSEAQIEAFEDTWHWGPAAQAAYEEVVTGPHQNVARMLKAMVEGLTYNDVTAYLSMMAIRLVELRRALKPTGSIYLHCDPTTGHYLKVLMDAVFGPEGFRNEIVWRRTGAHGPRRSFGPIHDTLLFYTKTQSYFFRVLKRPYMRGHVERRYSKDELGRYKFTSGGNVLTGAGATGGESGLPWKGFNPSAKNRHWAIPGFLSEQMPAEFQELGTLAKLDALYEAGLVEIAEGAAWPTPVRYLPADAGQPLQDMWAHQPYTEGTVHGSRDGIDQDVAWLGPTAPERLGYQTQKPLALLERIINASSNPGDVVLDPFCGCGTAVHAAQKLDRRWIGIDITPLATGLIRRRMQDAFAGIEINVDGEPKDLTGARELAATNPKHFEYWAVLKIDGAPTGGKGPDLDGVLPFIEFGGKAKRAVISVKGTKTVSPEMLRELKGAMNGDKPIGILVTLAEPTKGMVTQAAAAGFYGSADRKYPRVQILTVRQILNGKRPEMPPRRSPFAEAPLEREKAKTTRML